MLAVLAAVGAVHVRADDFADDFAPPARAARGGGGARQTGAAGAGSRSPSEVGEDGAGRGAEILRSFEPLNPEP